MPRDYACRYGRAIFESSILSRSNAMGKVERLLQASFVRLEVEDPASVDARWCLERYFAELNELFEGGFDRSVVLSAEPHELRPPAGYFIIARVHDQLAGCGALKLQGSGPAELKRMWVNPVARGLGIGRRLLTELERHASEAGACAVRLETNRVLREAIQLYRRSGYVEIAPFNREPHAHHWFEKRRKGHLGRVSAGAEDAERLLVILLGGGKLREFSMGEAKAIEGNCPL
jgi:GNAT superfamily N-acetyltransferase